MGSKAGGARAFGISILALTVIGLLAPSASAQTPLDCPTCTVDDAVESAEKTIDKITGGGDGNGGDGQTDPPHIDEIDEFDPSDEDFLGDDFLTDDVPDMVGQIVDPAEEDKGKKDPTDDGKTTRPGPDRDPVGTTGRPVGTTGPLGHDHGKIGSPPAREAAFAGDIVDRSVAEKQVGSVSGSAGVVEEALDALGEAIENLSFPLGLALAVLGYLMIQGRIDSRDPKLTLAAVDSEGEFLSFR